VATHHNLSRLETPNGDLPRTNRQDEEKTIADSLRKKTQDGVKIGEKVVLKITHGKRP